MSIVCTNYNKGDWIKDAIESFLRQKTDFSYEIILIDDHSTDHSPQIIKEYAKKYPNTIRTFFNKKNLGITRTWIKVCKEAKGKYIARCDGDDYWIDTLKLQKQVDLLEETVGSEWCSTDYNIVNGDKKVIHSEVFNTGIIDRPVAYEDMLATKGFTAPSSWLVSTTLLQEVNDSISKNAIDDTFNIQLELFKRTKSTYIPEVTVCYRENEGSDSRPVDIEALKRRDEGLYRTQIEYLKKYPDFDHELVIDTLFRRDMDRDDRLRLIHRQRKHIEAQERILVEKDKLISQKNEQIQQRDAKIIELLESKRYKIGKVITAPVSVARSIIKRGKDT